MRRAQENQEVFASDPEFDKFIGMKQEAFEAFVETYINGCVQWKEGSNLEPLNEDHQLVKVNQDLYKRFKKK